MSYGRSRSELNNSSVKFGSQRATSVPNEKYYTVLSEQPSQPFGFGSQASARPETKFPDVPGPGRYEPRPSSIHFESIRGHGLGFTSKSRRRLEWPSKAIKTPAPSQYSPEKKTSELKITISPILQRRCLCYPDERVASETPGPSDYTIAPPQKRKAPSSVFQSKTERSIWGIPEKPKPRFDGRTLVVPGFH